MKEKVTMGRIADKLGVSKNAVSLALRNMPGVSGELRDSVFAAAKELGYRYKEAGAGDPSLKNISILVSGKISRDCIFFEQVLSGIEAAARQCGYTCAFYWCGGPEGDAGLPLRLTSERTCGIACVGIFDRGYVQSLQQTGVPVVLVDHYFDDLPAHCVLTDNVGSACRMTQWLLGLFEGPVGFVGDTTYSPSFFDRWLGYVKAHKKLGRAVDEAFTLRDGRDAAALKPLPEAFFCCNDVTAALLMKELGAAGRQVPRDVSVAGFDDDPYASYLHPGLSTMRVDKRRLGEVAFQRLKSLIADPAAQPDVTLVGTELVVRDSVARKL